MEKDNGATQEGGAWLPGMSPPASVGWSASPPQTSRRSSGTRRRRRSQDAFQEIQIVKGVLMRFPSRQDRRSRSQRWNDAVQVLLDLQEEYREWLDELPEGLRLAPGAQKLAAVCKRDLKALRVELKPMEGS